MSRCDTCINQAIKETINPASYSMSGVEQLWVLVDHGLEPFDNLSADIHSVPQSIMPRQAGVPRLSRIKDETQMAGARANKQRIHGTQRDEGRPATVLKWRQGVEKRKAPPRAV
ncbi:hypothetical protein [Rhodovulum strictum]|uniref:Uncharacterized protein n=1 Tax=Rhodovulum strictum TaxID=58314 RepID=A0A844B9C4_9RHOB|nr:hypothetical protein [Rhodovulum strictum]MRH22986.1 hypothetical protein [Rhodovulum strictum]